MHLYSLFLFILTLGSPCLPTEAAESQAAQTEMGFFPLARSLPSGSTSRGETQPQCWGCETSGVILGKIRAKSHFWSCGTPLHAMAGQAVPLSPARGGFVGTPVVWVCVSEAGAPWTTGHGSHLVPAPRCGNSAGSAAF